MDIRCTSCFGKKQVMKLGLLYGDCDKCEGSGRIRQSGNSLVDKDHLKEAPIVKTKKKTGPKPKVINAEE